MEIQATKYGIVLTNWYQEVGNQYEHYKGELFDDMEEACIYLIENYNEMTDEFPVVEISIKLIK